ncbi:toll/interleukin-1 receptor domain-containing protein [Flavobacterium sp. ANB]|uniref:toll/interleukin-1 receptor domain-containing protein n=1 Tax=unclassified Flavobacterium TaxID=196869 RepID=UPI0012B7711F|nr:MULTISPECIES: toll/interleukin-1 receptor domain-containing protein [unclassified Flavobacterium]MBF4515844.1 toll/interleukin-1 receptor domain-containing protein [Flavobacterium sp. ANB]MTD68846.1 TIR domain-containing protein [Flavobacterium sp. LC2016-13]
MPKIFISYSWSSSDHEQWVLNLAERLVSDGIEVVLDKWDLKPGNDKYKFMESMVGSPEIEKVLLILDKKYAERANGRSGGVGTETQIISPQIYNNTSQEKFIPIIAERDSNNSEHVPVFLKGTVYIDLSSLDHYESNYEQLLRNIFKRPSYTRPKLGKAPSYLFENIETTIRTSSIIRTFSVQIDKDPKRLNGIIKDFLDEFYSDLQNYRLEPTSNEFLVFGKEILDNINSYTPLRNDFIEFINKLLKTDLDFDLDIIISFLEKLPLYLHHEESNHRYSSDNFKFIIHELFLYLIAVGLKNERYDFIDGIMKSTYFVENRYESKLQALGIEVFYNYIMSIEQYYNETYSGNFVSPMADLMIKRIPEKYTKENLIDADLICHYIAVICMGEWFPITYHYKDRWKSFPFFDKFLSRKHFNKVKMLFGVENEEELKLKLIELKKTTDSQPLRHSKTFDKIIPIFDRINIEEIGTVN